MKLGLTWGYWGALPPGNLVELTQEAERLGFDSVWSAEAWGSDAFSPLAYLAAHTSTIKLGTGVVQLSGRTPTAAAMHAITIDHLSQGRLILGLGVSGPQVVEGWYGQPYRKPLARTREYVEIIRKVLAREEPLEFQGEFHQHPYRGEGSTGFGKPLKVITHPFRREIPIFLGAEGPKNIALTAEIADGWLPLFFTPRMADTYNEWLDEGFARPGARRTRDDFEVCATAQIYLTDDRASVLAGLKPVTALYMGGMGSEDTNFHAEVYRRMGYGELVDEVTALFRGGRKEEAAAAIPDEVISESTLIGDADSVREQIRTWEAAGVTTLLVTAGSAQQIRDIATLAN